MERGKNFALKILLVLILSLPFPLYTFPEEEAVKMWEELLILPTYLVGKPDRYPIFYTGRAYQGAKGPIYPYPMLDKLTDIREDRSYQAVYLENRYVKLCILPDLGGRLFSAQIKTNSYDFVYRQQVIKPALIGMLGAWISGGVEWNIPHHHRATTFMPVDYTLEENPDGSKTVWVGEIERRHRMKWIVGLTLYPDKSYLEVTIRIFNRTPLAHSILCWANIAVHANKDYQVIFPPQTEFATFHGKNQFSEWPLSNQVYNGVDYTLGVDISWWKNHPEPTSFFAWNDEEDFMAGYDHGRQAGICLYADHHAAPGKKFWTWGTGAQGRRWEKMLTDTDGPYLELMVGAYSDNQPDYSWLEPFETREVKMYWFPLRQIGGVKKANREAALNLERASSNRVKIGVQPTSARNGGRVVLKEGEKIIFEKTVDAGPDHPFVEGVAFPRDELEESLCFAFYSSEGAELISYRPAKIRGEARPRPVEPPKPPQEIKSVEELLLTGRRLEQFYNPALEPYPYYEEALRRDPENYQANTALGILYLKRGMFEEAERKLRQAGDRASQNYTRPKDGEALYYLGVALDRQGKQEEAFDAFQRAAWSSAWSSASCYFLAEICSRKKEYAKALEFLDKSLLLNALSAKAINLKSAILRRLGRFREAGELARKALSLDRLDFWAQNEIYLTESSQGPETKAQQLKSLLVKKMRDDTQSYLEIASDYGNAGLWDEAVEILFRIKTHQEEKREPTSPLSDYYLAYYLEKKGEGEKAREHLAKAATLSPDYCFPYRLESIAILRRAQERNPEDSRAPYYLGNLLYDFQPEEAVKEWEKSLLRGGDFALLYRNLGLAYARVQNNLDKAVACLEKAVELDRKEPRLYYELDLLLESAGVPLARRLSLLEENHEAVAQRDDALSREIELLIRAGNYDRAIELLQGHHFHIWEGGGGIQEVYVDAQLLRGQRHFRQSRFREALSDYQKALEYPENLEVGRPSGGGREPQIEYFSGEAWEALGDLAEAKKLYEKSAVSPKGPSELSYYQGLALKKLGELEKARGVFEGLKKLGQERLKDTPSLDFFAKFGERQSAAKRMARAHYLLGLGFLGLGRNQEAKEEFELALQFDPGLVWAEQYLSRVDKK